MKVEIDVRDRDGLVHKLQYQSGQWFGHDNLAQSFPAPVRSSITNQVLSALTCGWPLPHGFERCPV